MWSNCKSGCACGRNTSDVLIDNRDIIRSQTFLLICFISLITIPLIPNINGALVCGCRLYCSFLVVILLVFGPLSKKKQPTALLLISLTHRTGTVIIFLFYDRSMALYYNQNNTLYCVTSCVATHVPLFRITQRQKKRRQSLDQQRSTKRATILIGPCSRFKKMIHDCPLVKFLSLIPIVFLGFFFPLHVFVCFCFHLS